MRNISWENSTNFQRLPSSSILQIDFLKFSENQDNDFDSDHAFLISLNWERHHQLQIFFPV